MRPSTRDHVVHLRGLTTTLRLAVLPGRRPEWQPPHRLVGLLYRTVAVAGPATP